MRRGFTLIETLVALVILEFTMLAVGAATAVAARNFTVAHRSSTAQAIARNRMEALLGRACGDPTSGGGVIPGGYDERWTIVTATPLRHLSVDVDYDLFAGRRARVSLTSSAWCGG